MPLTLACISALQAVRSAKASGLAALFPPRCAGCEAPLNHHTLQRLCHVCWNRLEPNQGPRCPRCDVAGADVLCPTCFQHPPVWTALRAPWIYGGPLADMLVAVKFAGREDKLQALGQLLAADAVAQRWAHQAQGLVPVPLGPQRQRQRGYNQSAGLARYLHHAWGIPVRHALRRRRETVPQSRLSLAQRRENMRQAFEPRLALNNHRIVVLIDDVVTSGATVGYAAQALLRAGAQRVVVIAAARAAQPYEP